MNFGSDTAPPGYSEREELPPGYTAGTTYTIGKHALSGPLVQIPHLKAHLSLLRAINGLRTIIEEGRDPRIPRDVFELDAPQRWAWFVGLAVERYRQCRDPKIRLTTIIFDVLGLRVGSQSFAPCLSTNGSRKRCHLWTCSWCGMHTY